MKSLEVFFGSFSWINSTAGLKVLNSSFVKNKICILFCKTYLKVTKRSSCIFKDTICNGLLCRFFLVLNSFDK